MSDQVAGLVISLVASALILTIATLIRVRGPEGLVRHVDWNRVSDPQALGHYLSLIMSLMGCLIAAHGVMRYAFQGSHEMRNIGSIVFVILMALLALAILLGQLRYQDKPRRDGRR